MKLSKILQIIFFASGALVSSAFANSDAHDTLIQESYIYEHGYQEDSIDRYFGNEKEVNFAGTYETLSSLLYLLSNSHPDSDNTTEWARMRESAGIALSTIRSMSSKQEATNVGMSLILVAIKQFVPNSENTGEWSRLRGTAHKLQKSSDPIKKKLKRLLIRFRDTYPARINLGLWAKIRKTCEDLLVELDFAPDTRELEQ